MANWTGVPAEYSRQNPNISSQNAADRSTFETGKSGALRSSLHVSFELIRNFLKISRNQKVKSPELKPTV